MKLSDLDALEIVFEMGNEVYRADQPFDGYTFTDFLNDLNESPEERELFIKIVNCAFEKGKLFSGSSKFKH